MDEATLTALRESIEKWEKRAAGEHDGNLGCSSCPLCKLFHDDYREDGEYSCIDCPIYEKTDVRFCDGSPYADYAEDQSDENASDMLNFLKSLLPAEQAEEEKPKAAFNWTDLDYLK